MTNGGNFIVLNNNNECFSLRLKGGKTMNNKIKLGFMAISAISYSILASGSQADHEDRRIKMRIEYINRIQKLKNEMAEKKTQETIEKLKQKENVIKVAK